MVDKRSDAVLSIPELGSLWQSKSHGLLACKFMSTVPLQAFVAVDSCYYRLLLLHDVVAVGSSYCRL